MGILDWLNAYSDAITVIVVVLTGVGGLYAYVRYGRKSGDSPPRQRTGDRGVNVGGDNSGDINTGSQTTRREK